MSQRTLRDPAPPASLYKLQKWFGGLIRTPLTEKEELSCKTAAKKRAIAAKIAPSPQLAPYQRAEIYNQQYWWRFQKTMSNHYPGLVRLFGEADFMQLLVIPYLSSRPPKFWDLNLLGHDFPDYLERHYHEADRELIVAIAALESAMLDLYFVESPPDNEVSEEKYFKEKKTLAPTARLFSWQYEFLPFRKALLEEEPSHWLKNPFPKLQKKGSHVVLFRNVEYRIVFDPITEAEYTLLTYFQKPFSLEKLCDIIEGFDEPMQKEVEENLQLWVGRWIQKRLLTPVKRRSSRSKGI